MVDAGNGKLTVQWVNGNPAFDDAESEAVFSLLMEPAGWYGDKAKKRRTLIPTIKTKDGGTAGRLEQYARDALQPLIDDGRLRSVDVTVAESGSGYMAAVAYVTGRGKTGALSVPLSV